MKTGIQKLGLLLLGLLLCIGVGAQENSEPQLMVIHEDYLLPSKVESYKEVVKELNSNLLKHGFSDLVTYAHLSDDFVFMYSSPIKDMADLDRNWVKELYDKMGAEAFNKMWDGYNDKYSHHRSFVVAYHPDLSYSAEGKPTAEHYIPKEHLYRHWTFLYCNANQAGKMHEMAKEWVELYKSKKSEVSFFYYTSVMGLDDDLVVIMTSYKDAAHMAEMDAKNSDLMEGDAKALWSETSEYIREVKEVSGWMLPELSILPTP